MNNDLMVKVDYRINRLSFMVKRLEEKIKNLPNGQIKVKRRRSGICYYQSTDKGDKYIIKENQKLAEDLMQKRYLEKVLKAAESELAVLIYLKKQYPRVVAEDIFDSLTEERKMIVKPIVPTDDQFIQKWMEEPYEPKPISKDTPFYQTMKGERVRSKSEMIIADRLYAKGIPYKYECPLIIGKKTIHPDFTILRLSDREVVYYEHCGKMDDPQYAEDMVNRVNDYSHVGIVAGDKLFMTFETSKTPMDVRVLDNMIEANFR